MEGTVRMVTACHSLGRCRHVIHEADYMAASSAITIREQVKTPGFGVLAAQFSVAEVVQQIKRQFLKSQILGDEEGMDAATNAFHAHLRGSDYHREVVDEVRTLIAEMNKTSITPGVPRATNALRSTRLDFASHPIFQVPIPENGTDSTDIETIEAMRSSSSCGGYLLMWLEALARGRGEGNEEGVGSFIMSILDLHTSDRETWVAFKQAEFKWVRNNFASQGLAMSVNLFPADFLNDGIVHALLSLYSEDADAFRLLHVELLDDEKEDVNRPQIIDAILTVHHKTGLMLARDDVKPETLADPVKRNQLIQLYKSLAVCLTVMKLDSSLVCGAMNVPLVPRSFDRQKAHYDKEVSSKRRYREAWAAGMIGKRTFPFPLDLVDSEHWTQSSVVRTFETQREAVNHAGDVVEGFVEVSTSLRFNVDIVAESSVYANDFQRQLGHPIFGPFVETLLVYAKLGKLFVQGSMGGGRAVSDAVVPHITTNPVRDTTGTMKALLLKRHNHSCAGADETFHIDEDREVYVEFPETVNRMRSVSERLGLVKEFDVEIAPHDRSTLHTMSDG